DGRHAVLTRPIASAHDHPARIFGPGLSLETRPGWPLAANPPADASHRHPVARIRFYFGGTLWPLTSVACRTLTSGENSALRICPLSGGNVGCAFFLKYFCRIHNRHNTLDLMKIRQVFLSGNMATIQRIRMSDKKYASP